MFVDAGGNKPRTGSVYSERGLGRWSGFIAAFFDLTTSRTVSSTLVYKTDSQACYPVHPQKALPTEALRQAGPATPSTSALI